MVIICIILVGQQCILGHIVLTLIIYFKKISLGMPRIFFSNLANQVNHLRPILGNHSEIMKKVVAALNMVLLIYVTSSSAVERVKGDDLAKELLVNAECKEKDFFPINS